MCKYVLSRFGKVHKPFIPSFNNCLITIIHFRFYSFSLYGTMDGTGLIVCECVCVCMRLYYCTYIEWSFFFNSLVDIMFVTFDVDAWLIVSISDQQTVLWYRFGVYFYCIIHSEKESNHGHVLKSWIRSPPSHTHCTTLANR